MDLDPALLLTLFAIGFIGSLVSGMVGIGGSIIKYPLLLYVPPLLGLATYSAQEVAAISAVQVFFASLAGALAHRKNGFLHYKLVWAMGIPITLGAFVGGFGSKFLPDDAVNLTYAFLALLAAVMMFLPKEGMERQSVDGVEVRLPVAVPLAAIIGILSGIVGAAGAFILIPVMLVILKIPIRVAIASSLAITFLSSIGTTVGKVMGGHMLLVPAVVMVVASVLASPLGVKLGNRMNVKVLQWILAVLITATVIKIWVDILLG